MSPKVLFHRTEAAAVAVLDATLKYVIEAEEFPEVASNAVVLVDAACQYSRPSSAAASPNLFRGVQIEGAFSVFVDRNSVYPV